MCGTELQPLQDGATDVQGIHTHGDGLVHIHPFTRQAAGKRATLAKYFKQVGFTVTDSGFQLPDGMTMEDGSTTVEEGETTCGGKPGELVLAHWEDATTAASSEPDKIYREGFGDVRFSENLGAYTLAFIPKGSDGDINAPSSAASIAELGACDGPNPPASCGPTGGATTVPTVPETTGDTTADTTATTAAGDGG